MPSRRGAKAATASLLAALLPLSLAFTLSSCPSPPPASGTGIASDKAELAELFGLLEEKVDEAERFAILRQISSNLIRHKEYSRLAALLASLSESDQTPPYGAWYLFTAAYAYEQSGSAPVAAIYYDRALKLWPDAEVDGTSIHRECLTRLIGIVDSPERRIGYYKDLLARFPEEEEGANLFLLAKEYEGIGDWNLAIKTYSAFLPFFGAAVPGYPDAFRYARGVIDFYHSPKDWAYKDLKVLVARVKAALASGDSYRLKACRAKVNFFAMDWQGDDSRTEGKSLFDFAEYMGAGRVQAAVELEAGSSAQEAYLKTWGWADKITTWYLCFRKIRFPANPEVHGSWEWAGIYFGEKVQ